MTIAYFILDRTGRIDPGSGKNRAIYMILSVLPFIPVFTGLAAAFDPSRVTYTGEETGIALSAADAAPILWVLIAVINAVFCVIGFIGTGRDTESADAEGLFSFGAATACFSVLLLAAAAVIFAAAAVTFAGALIVRLLVLFLAGLVLAVFTFGIGIVVAAFLAIFYAPVMGIEAFAACAPLFEMSGAAMVLFFIFHIFAACAGITAVRRLYKDKIYTARKNAVMTILCCLPAVNIPVLMYLSHERKQAGYSMI